MLFFQSFYLTFYLEANSFHFCISVDVESLWVSWGLFPLFIEPYRNNLFCLALWPERVACYSGMVKQLNLA